MDHLPQILLDILAPLMPIYEVLDNFELFGNSGIDYLLVPIIFILAFVISYIIKFVILGRIKHILPSKGSEITEPVIEKVKSLINFTLVFFVALYLSLQHLTLTPNFSIFLDAVIFGIIFYAIYRFISGLIDAGAEYRERKTEHSQEHILAFITLIGKIAAASLILLWYLSSLEINVSGLVAGLGIAGITIAFALQSIVADLFAAIAIYLDRPFELGDFIVVGDKSGTIEKIGIRTTHIRSPDGPLIVISNQNLTNSDITNYQKMEKRRVQQVIGVSAEAPIEQLRRLPEKFTEIANDIEMVEVDRVWLKELGNYSWNYEIIYFVQDRSPDTWRRVQEELNFRILELMEKEDIELPYPIQEIQINGKSSIVNPLKSKANSQTQSNNSN